MCKEVLVGIFFNLVSARLFVSLCLQPICLARLPKTMFCKYYDKYKIFSTKQPTPFQQVNKMLISSSGYRAENKAVLCIHAFSPQVLLIFCLRFELFTKVTSCLK